MWMVEQPTRISKVNVRFTVAGISGAVSSAQLRVYVTDATRNGPALYTTSNTWTETGITWNNHTRTSGTLEDKGALAVAAGLITT